MSSAHSDPLTRLDTPVVLHGPMSLTGLYVYFADAATFTDCRTGRRWPVLIEGAHLKLERTYLQRRSGPAEPLLARVSARFVSRSPEPGGVPREFIRIEAVKGTAAGQSCASAARAGAKM
ncbi:MAG: hypothetical protein ABIR94_06665 [Rubrivivax sp.]